MATLYSKNARVVLLSVHVVLGMSLFEIMVLAFYKCGTVKKMTCVLYVDYHGQLCG